jgi:hypothetical protein
MHENRCSSICFDPKASVGDDAERRSRDPGFHGLPTSVIDAVDRIGHSSKHIRTVADSPRMPGLTLESLTGRCGPYCGIAFEHLREASSWAADTDRPNAVSTRTRR